MELEAQKIRQQNRDIVLLLVVPIAIVAKLIQFYILPGKYFYDSWRLVSMLTGNATMASWTGYQTTVDFYDLIDIFNLTSQQQWSIFMGAIMTPVVIVILSRAKEMNVRESIFALMAVGLLNIYVFTISKEGIQIMFFFLIYVIISLPIKNTLIKVIACAGIFYWESTFYRSYYIIMAAMTVALYFIFYKLRNMRKEIKPKYVALVIIACIVMIFAFLYASKFIAPEDFMDAINVRDTSANENAVTVILNPFMVNNNYGIFMIDYVIAAVRMMFPIELIVKSPAYFPFFIYQIFILYYFIRTLKNIKKIDNKMIVAISCFSAYILGSFIFEPDFGSWVRHEAAAFPLMQLMAFHTNVYDQNAEKEKKDNHKEVIIYETENV